MVWLTRLVCSKPSIRFRSAFDSPTSLSSLSCERYGQRDPAGREHHGASQAGREQTSGCGGLRLRMRAMPPRLRSKWATPILAVHSS
eukprot:6713330-Prymnesium_polylepis.1